ncbi:DUF2249 domain-containing protein [Uliginosibacterium sp. H3]|uniref:DUF2249 domain-containing protein n=1 Tax=Uliginosibacterium silvisoli TaxID=3114758 RepID=A0ABU6K6K8_9RHOO|nr:DUF2249 domain-containing protein [Uliginosibacterium sp. H3]
MSETFPSIAVTLDVRAIQPRERHPLIFGIFEALPPGQALLLTNDHDPKPLYYQFEAESKGQFSWDYVSRGPEVWQVRIGRQPAGKAEPSSCCGSCN